MCITETINRTFFRIAAALTALVLLVTPAMSARAESYSASDAVSYANSHYNDGKGQCAEFVSNCLKKGGVSAYSKVVSSLLDALKSGNYGSLYKLTAYNDEIYTGKNSGKVAAGDAIFFRCDTCGTWAHCAIVTKINSKGVVYCAQHNPGQKDMHWLPTYYSKKHPKSHDITVYSFHMSAGSEPVQEKKKDNPMKVSASKTSLSRKLLTTQKVTLTVKGAEGKVTYKSSDTGIATVSDSGVVTVKRGKYGTVKITVSAAGNSKYESGSQVITITIRK